MSIEQYRKRFFNLMESTMGDVRPLLNEQDDYALKYGASVTDCSSPGAVSFFKQKYPEVLKMASYADSKIGSRMNSGACAMKTSEGHIIKTSTATNLVPGTDENAVWFYAYNNGKTEIKYTNDYGIDPNPISFPKTFEEFKKWFDSVGFMG